MLCIYKYVMKYVFERYSYNRNKFLEKLNQKIKNPMLFKINSLRSRYLHSYFSFLVALFYKKGN